jgi:hypothetical protein
VLLNAFPECFPQRESSQAAAESNSAICVAASLAERSWNYSGPRGIGQTGFSKGALPRRFHELRFAEDAFGEVSREQDAKALALIGFDHKDDPKNHPQ